MNLPIPFQKTREGMASRKRAASSRTGFGEISVILDWEPMLDLFAGNQLEYDARHVSVPGVNFSPH